MIKYNDCLQMAVEDYDTTIGRINKAIDTAKESNSDSCKLDVPTAHVHPLTRAFLHSGYGFFITIDGHKVNTRLATCLIFFYSNPPITTNQ